MNWLLFAAAVSGFHSVVAGAVGHHVFSLGAESENFETAVRYHQLYSIFLAALSLHKPSASGKLFFIACAFFLAGMIIFSGSLYLLVLTGTAGYGFFMPPGGIMLMAGWLLLAVYAVRNSFIP